MVPRINISASSQAQVTFRTTITSLHQGKVQTGLRGLSDLLTQNIVCSWFAEQIERLGLNCHRIATAITITTHKIMMTTDTAAEMALPKNGNCPLFLAQPQ